MQQSQMFTKVTREEQHLTVANIDDELYANLDGCFYSIS